MGISSLHEFIEASCKEACVPVDLLQIARGYSRGNAAGRFRLVIDAESCLDRLYGGFYSDWACGGEWNRMVHFLTNLTEACRGANLELVVFFSGALEKEKMRDWEKEQTEKRKRANLVLKHVFNKATPPPKVWWLPPVCLRPCLRMALRHMGVQVACSMDDHHQEVIAYCRENDFQGILAQDAVYTIFDPPRYFSSEHLKLTYKGTLETREYFVNAVAKALDLNPTRFCVFAALLGDHILPEDDLRPFFRELLTVNEPGVVKAQPTKQLILEVASFVRELVSIDDLDAIGRIIFRNCPEAIEEKIGRFKQSVQYYLNGTEDGFLKYRPKLQGLTSGQPGRYPKQQASGDIGQETGKQEQKPDTVIQQESEASAETGNTAQKTEELDIEADSIYTQAPSGYGAEATASADLPTPQIVIEPPVLNSMEPPAEEERKETGDLAARMEAMTLEKTDDSEPDRETQEINGSAGQGDTSHLQLQRGDRPEALLSSSSSSSSGSSPHHFSAEIPVKPPAMRSGMRRQGCDHLPPVSPEIMRVVSERHQKGLMMPWIYQCLAQGEIKISVSLEDENGREFLPVVQLYRPIRQYVYAILFNLSKLRRDKKSQSGSPVPEAVIKERSYTKEGPQCEDVQAITMDWMVPTIHRLWLGQQIEDKNRRLRAFLTCMRSDSPVMLNTSYVPQHLLIMCCILRYLMSQEKHRVLRRQELDAFLAQAVSPLLQDIQTMQDMKLPMLTTRGVQLGALFMRGVECAIFANDACGAPVPWTMTCPWLYFDGKLFHYKLLKANNNTPLVDICDGSVEQVMRVERMRQAILHGLTVDFAKPALPLPPVSLEPSYLPYRPAGMPVPPPMGHNMRPQPTPPHQGMMGMHPTPDGRGRGLLGPSPIDPRGGQLSIAGVVVGQWGPQPRGRGTHINQLGPVPPRRYGPGGGMPGMHSGMRGRGTHFAQGPGRMQHGRGVSTAKPKRGRSGMAVPLSQQTKMEGGGRGRGCTVEVPSDSLGAMPVSEFMKVDFHKEAAQNEADVEKVAAADAEEGIVEGQFQNAADDSIEQDEDSAIQVKGQGMLSPDSGIQESSDLQTDLGAL
ncbi:constitutive coactivator of PPAR-gamma-like protein 1 isoform X2 [Lingula anatina]|uniref:Constitutive coactivator of PPAR-gamma-like protein 1 isoform X2 n=1 Tax=Lingula anatina TaxID=7574 RepID=A0A1S3JFD8_LINAN|nr:constitutive coactivator of PPAR-gamma-like protein 1 isoform X2 [Lingula anatina]|eukprot:XP_013408866.1 constitutive coactivator of PPAR-gamma-like protein 1 isoform X2 [Lingula anatina]